MTKAGDIDEYIAGFPEEIRNYLKEIRNIIRSAAPEAIETISYAIPTFTLNGNLVHFAAFKNHIGFYPTSSGIEAFREELSAYKGSKGSVQFPYRKQLPKELILNIVKCRVQENMERKRKKTESKKKTPKN